MDTFARVHFCARAVTVISAVLAVVSRPSGGEMRHSKIRCQCTDVRMYEYAVSDGVEACK